MKAPNAAALTASSRSASSSTISGALPPSSSSTGLSCSAARLATIRPTAVEPVKLIRRTAGWSISAPTTSPASAGALVTRLTTPSGKPASANASTIRAWVRGQRSDALRMTVLPQASGVAIARQPRITGAFHGAMPSTTPAGSRSASDSRPGLSEGMTSPPICVVSAAASRTMPAPSMTLNRAHGSDARNSSRHQRGEPVGAGVELFGGPVEQGAAGVRPGAPTRRGRRLLQHRLRRVGVVSIERGASPIRRPPPPLS